MESNAFQASLKQSTNQTIALCKELFKTDGVFSQDAEFKSQAKETLGRLSFQFLKYKRCIHTDEMLSFLQQIANSVSFCFLQDEDPVKSDCFLVTVAGCVLVVDLCIPKQMIDVERICTKISAANCDKQTEFLVALEERICLLLSEGDYFELQQVFTVLKQLDSGSLPMLSQVYADLFAEQQKLEILPQFHQQQPAATKAIAAIVGKLGVFEVWQSVFPVVYFYAPLEKLFEAKVLAGKDDFVSWDAFQQAKRCFYSAKLTWQEEEAKIHASFSPSVTFHSAFFQEFAHCKSQFDGQLKLESMSFASTCELMEFLLKLKLFLTLLEIVPEIGSFQMANKVSFSVNGVVYLMEASAPDEIRVFEESNGNLKREASIAATISRSLKIIKAYL